MTKLLLVEDDNNLREIYEARLAAEGYEISSAKDGEEALEVAKKDKPDLIISDVMMPRISGFEMLDILRNTDGLRNTKIIMLTALGQSEDRTRADNLGADRYLVKSQVTLEDIVKAASELLDPNVATAEQAATHSADTPAELSNEAPAPSQTEQTQSAVAAQPEPAPAPAPEQTAATPMPTPVATEPVTTPAPDSSAQTIPVVEAPAEPAPAPEQIAATPMPTPVFSPAADDNQTQNDAIINTAMNDLSAPSTTDTPAPAGSTVQPASADNNTGTTTPAQSAPTGGQRVISPLDSAPGETNKVDLAALAAQEESAATETGKPIVGGQSPQPQVAAPTTPPAPNTATVFQPNEGGSSNQSAL